MNIVIQNTNPAKEDFIALHKTTGWNQKGLFTYDQLYEAICNSWFSASIYHNNKLIAYGRILSDGIYQTFICDVMVLPEYQGQGIGRKVIELLLEKCKENGIQWVQLFSAKGKQEFYLKLGFTIRDQAAPGMSIFL
ncbi:GNAT family N-acetyltransferase [Bacillus weihaiensis]|uniref:GNAT family acetyltransferase n=1 Tax=Bacillus weihaiensis TaxID=1547283 RepID=A0A1L3MRG8_9BACI|nr:GNAT family N-acetyltransferase [Bacillus weihaiensis]APH04907.1 GNAT family acetyltransferase [Bacillus weihaiensis]